ncbi:MAG TPA: tetratricopeptide repeat protein [Terracidiphilus sp.]|nr:tetratricopeptide repeat protein [Terracidiphilus sp.]
MKGSSSTRIVALVLGLLVSAGLARAASARVDTNPMNYDPQVREAFHYFYNLDFPQAVSRFERFRAEHPGDPQATDYLLEAELFQELYRQDLLDTTFYANDGFLTGHHAIREDPEARDRILGLADEAVREADWRINKNPNDIDALFARGWALSLKCTYLAMVERDFRGGFHLANKANDDEERVLQLDPNYVDAKLITGIYQYVVGALPWPFRLLIGFVGISGNKSTGLAMLTDAGKRGVITSMEARTALALFLRRESKYQEAVKVVQSLKNQYPHNFLFCLEEANLRRDAGEGMVAVTAYRDLLSDAARPGYFASPQLELAWFGMGDALRGQRHYEEAAQAYERAGAAHSVGPELKIRALLAGGECRDILGQRALAVDDYYAAIKTDPKTSRADTARDHLRTPYKGK